MSLLDSVLADRYVLGAPLGRGGMAEVRAAHDRRLDRTVAVKIFDAAAWATPEGRARFETEAHLAASVTHPNVVAVYDVGIDGNVSFLVIAGPSGARSVCDDDHRGNRAADDAPAPREARAQGKGR